MKSFITTLLILVAGASFSQTTPNYEIIFREASSHLQRRILIRDLLEDGVDLGDFINRAFIGVYQNRYGASNVGKEDLLRLLISNLTEPLNVVVNDSLRFLFGETTSTAIQYEIYRAWGRFNVEEQFDFVIQRMAQILESQSRSFVEEVEAFSGVTSLSLYNRDESIPILIRISEGWFSGRSGVKALSETTLSQWSGRGRESVLEAIDQTNDIGIISVLVKGSLKLYSQEPNEDFIVEGFNSALNQVYSNPRDRQAQQELIQAMVDEIVEKELPNASFGPSLIEAHGLMDDLNVRLEILKAMIPSESAEVDPFVNIRLQQINELAENGQLTSDLQREVNGILDLIIVRGGAIYVQALSDMRTKGYEALIVDRAISLARAIQ